MDAQKLLQECIGFEWDEGNKEKNWIDHQVTVTESEEVFFNQPLFVTDSTQQNESEDRYYALGQTNMERLLFIVFTIRKKQIRVISARDMSRKERKVYHHL
jgi:uncharacterized DUF497 family protein